MLAFTLLLGTLGGALFAWFQLPLAWMIGSMVFCTTASMSGLPIRIPAGLRSGMIMILGIMLGSAFTPHIVDRLGEWAVSLAGLAFYIVLSAALGIVFLRKVARYDPVTAFFTATPGGLNEMVLVGAAMGGDDRTISVAHSARVMLVVMTVPVFFQMFQGYQPGKPGSAGAGPGRYADRRSGTAGFLRARRPGRPLAAPAGLYAAGADAGERRHPSGRTDDGQAAGRTDRRRTDRRGRSTRQPFFRCPDRPYRPYAGHRLGPDGSCCW